MALAVPGLERKTPENPFKYSEDELTDRKIALKTMMELWPDVNPLHAEWVYDMCKNTPADQMDEIKKKVETEPSRFKTVNDPSSHLYEEAKNFK